MTGCILAAGEGVPLVAVAVAAAVAAEPSWGERVASFVAAATEAFFTVPPEMKELPTEKSTYLRLGM